MNAAANAIDQSPAVARVIPLHRIDGRWRVTTKAFHIARIFPAGA